MIFKNKTKLNKNLGQKGFVLLFAVVLTSIILSIALSLADIAYKELSFGTQAKSTGEAFFASDAGLECALFYDVKGVPTEYGDYVSPFGYDGSFGAMSVLQCAGTSFQLNDGVFSLNGPWTFVLPFLGSTQKSCAVVLVDKISIPNRTRVVSRGYNVGNANCSGDFPNKVEREIELVYEN